MTFEPASEAELCDAFAEAARGDGWRVFPEVSGFDLVLEWDGTRPVPTIWRDREDVPIAAVDAGYQIGIDAKLRANIDVLAQAIGRIEDSIHRPDAAAVLVPEYSRAYACIAHRLGLRCFDLRNCAGAQRHTIDPVVPPPLWLYRGSHAGPDKRLALPPIPLRDSGGKGGPRTLSQWRVGALRVCALLRARGSLTRADAKPHGIDLADWAQRGWLVSDGKRPARYTPGLRLDVTGPEVGYEATRDALIAADAKPPGA